MIVLACIGIVALSARRSVDTLSLNVQEASRHAPYALAITSRGGESKLFAENIFADLDDGLKAPACKCNVTAPSRQIATTTTNPKSTPSVPKLFAENIFADLDDGLTAPACKCNVTAPSRQIATTTTNPKSTPCVPSTDVYTLITVAALQVRYSSEVRTLQQELEVARSRLVDSQQVERNLQSQLDELRAVLAEQETSSNSFAKLCSSLAKYLPAPASPTSAAYLLAALLVLVLRVWMRIRPQSRDNKADQLVLEKQEYLCGSDDSHHSNATSSSSPPSSPIPSLCDCGFSFSDESESSCHPEEIHLQNNEYDDGYNHHHQYHDNQAPLSPTAQEIEQMAQCAETDKPYSRSPQIGDGVGTSTSFDSDECSSVESSTSKKTRTLHPPPCLQRKNRLEATIFFTSPSRKDAKVQLRRIRASIKRAKATLKRRKNNPLLRSSAVAFVGTSLFSACSSLFDNFVLIFIGLFPAMSLLFFLIARHQRIYEAHARASSYDAKMRRRRMIRGPSTVRSPTRIRRQAIISRHTYT